ncbi:MAG: hypothetical protein ACJZ86_05500 [Pontiellaceae bacterium]
MRSNSFIFIFSFITVTVFADIGVNFGANSNPILKAGETEVTSETALDDDVLVQLLWSDTMVDYQSVGGIDSSLKRENEFVLETNTVNQYGTFSATTVSVFTDSDVGGADINAGYIYARIFDSAVPSFGSYYLEMGIQGFGLFEYNFLQPSSIYTDDFNDFGSVVAIDSQNSQVLNNNTNQPPEIISLTVSNAVGGTVNPLGTVIYYGASTVTLEADADLGYLFSSWVDENNNLYSTENPFSLNLTDDRTLIAQFGEDLSDEDEDGLSLYDEMIIYGSDPTLTDTSGDGLSDGMLVLMGLNPTVNFSNVISTVQSMPESFGVYGVAFVNELQTSITNLTEVTIAQSNEIAVTQAMLTELQAELTSLVSQNTALEAEVAGLTAANLALTDSVSALTDENSELTAQVGQLQASNSQLTTANQGLELTVATLNTEAAALNDQVVSLQTTNADLESQIVSLSTNANALLLDQIATLESTNSVLTGLVAELEFEIDTLEGDVVELQLEVADLEEALEDAYVSYDKPDWIWHSHWHYPWYKPNNYWWGWGNPPARYLPKWGREATVGKRVKMKRLKKRWNANRQEELAELELELCVETADDLVNGVWSATTNQVMIDIPVDDSRVKFYRINYN